MSFTGGCYCGQVRYEADGPIAMRGQCHCRECQYISGGAENLFLVVPADNFKYTQGQPSQFKRSDLERPVTREFCPNCGTHLTTRPRGPVVVVKVGGLDDPSIYEGPTAVLYTIDKQPFHLLPEGVPAFERMPGR